MRDERFEDELSLMLRGRAASLPGQGDPVGATKQHLKSAQTRRRTALSATAVLVVAGGAVLGGQAFGANTGTGHGISPAAQAAAPDSPAAAPVPITAPTLDPGTRYYPASAYGQPCGTETKVMHSDATKYTDGLRGSLATDTTLTDALKTRATALVGGTDAKVVYAGEDAATRVVVVYINPKTSQACEKGMLAVVFHGPAGTAAADLKAQASTTVFGPNFGFMWSERNADHSLTTLLLDPKNISTLQVTGDATNLTPGTTSTQSIPDGVYHHTYPAGTVIPAWYGFTAPDGRDAGNMFTFATTAPTKEAYADALGVNPSQVTDHTDPATHGIGATIIGYGVGPHSVSLLFATQRTDGLEKSYWSDFVGN